MSQTAGYPLISPAVVDLAEDSWCPRGDVIDHAWFRRVTWADGKPHLEAITILARVVYMYRPIKREIIGTDGLVVSVEARQKFAADAWQCSREALAQMFGFTVRQIDSALDTLDKRLNVINRERRTMLIGGVRVSNVLYLVLNITKLGSSAEFMGN